MLFGRVKVTVISTNHTEHQPRGVIIGLLRHNRTLQVSPSQHEFIKSEKVLSYKERENNVCRIQQQRFFEIANAAFGIAFDEQIGARVQKSGKQVEVVAAESVQHELDAFVEFL